jgi:hypothetical protein
MAGERKAILEKLLAKLPPKSPVQYSSHISGRGGDWVKTKCTMRQEFAIGGWRYEATSRPNLGSLLTGYYDKGKLIYAGSVGTGSSVQLGRSIMAKLQRIGRDTLPFCCRPRGRTQRAHIGPSEARACLHTLDEWRTIVKLPRVILAAGILVLVSAIAGIAAAPNAILDNPNAPVLELLLGFGFDHEGEAISIPEDPKLDFGPQDQMTLSVWVKLLNHPEVYHILGKRNAGCGAINYQIARDSRGISFNSDAGPVFTSVPDLPTNVWTQIKVTYASLKLTIYLNGKQVGSAYPYTLQTVNDAPLVIGGSGDCGNTFPGRIGLTTIFRRVGPQFD